MEMTALVLGATGSFGAAIAEKLNRTGWRTVAMHRNPETVTRTGSTPPRTEWIPGDAMNSDDVKRAAKNARVIIHAVNPPGYRDWEAKAIPMLENTIAAARETDARILLPGNIYNYGPDAGDMLQEGDPQNPVSRKGAVRVRMERMLKEAAQDGVRSIILRAGDYFGPHAPSGWIEGGMMKAGKPVKRVTYPGELGVGHSWAYLPDFAESAAALVECEADLPDFDSFHFAGHFLPRGEEFAEIIAQLAGGAKVSKLPWAAVKILGLINPTMREVSEMRYLWQTPHRLDGSKLTALMGEEPRTPLRQALHNTLDGMECLRPVGVSASPERLQPG